MDVLQMKGGNAFVLVLAGWGVLLILLISTTTEAAPAIAINSPEYAVNNQRDFRSRRGFKTVGLATARGFGKRSNAATSINHFLRNPSTEAEDDDDVDNAEDA